MLINKVTDFMDVEATKNEMKNVDVVFCVNIRRSQEVFFELPLVLNGHLRKEPDSKFKLTP